MKVIALPLPGRLLRATLGGEIERPVLPVVAVSFTYSASFSTFWVYVGVYAVKGLNWPASRVGLLFLFCAPAAAVANEYYVGAINRVGVEPLGENDFYGQSYFVDPEGQFVGEVGDAYKPELIVRDLDLGKIREVRDRWAFYRDRRPDAYDEIVSR